MKKKKNESKQSLPEYFTVVFLDIYSQKKNKISLLCSLFANNLYFVLRDRVFAMFSTYFKTTQH